MSYISNLFHELDIISMKNTIFRVLAVLLCIMIHEISHGLAAYLLGDDTAKENHRLSLNPLYHIDWIGLALMLFTGVGWAKPVPVNSGYFKKPKLGMALTAIAGPISNLLLSLQLLFVCRWLINSTVNQDMIYVLLNTAKLSIGLGVFNLIPIPPLDGSKVLAAFLPNKAYYLLMKYERFGFMIIFMLVLVGSLNDYLDNTIYFIYILFCRLIGLL